MNYQDDYIAPCAKCGQMPAFYNMMICGALWCPTCDEKPTILYSDLDAALQDWNDRNIEWQP